MRVEIVRDERVADFVDLSAKVVETNLCVTFKTDNCSV